MLESLSETERKIALAHDVVIELKEELQDGWADEILGITSGKRKVTPPEEFYSTEFPNKLDEEPEQ